MDLPLQILMVTVPSLVVLFVTYFMMKNNAETMQTFFQEEIKLRREEIKALNQNITGPMRVQAFERMILFLERISPDNLVLRVHQPDMNGPQFY